MPGLYCIVLYYSLSGAEAVMHFTLRAGLSVCVALLIATRLQLDEVSDWCEASEV